MISNFSPRELREFRDHLMKIGQGTSPAKVATKKPWLQPRVHCWRFWSISMGLSIIRSLKVRSRKRKMKN